MEHDQILNTILTGVLKKPNKAAMHDLLMSEHRKATSRLSRLEKILDKTANRAKIIMQKDIQLITAEILELINDRKRSVTSSSDTDFIRYKPIVEKLVRLNELPASVLKLFSFADPAKPDSQP